MTVGKNPHRPEGKKGADEWDDRKNRAHAEPPSYKEMHGDDRELMQERQQAEEDFYEPGQSGEDVQVGGSRPGVESRVKEAIEEREEREERERET